MYESKPISNTRNRIYRVATILLLAYAAFSSTMKDLSRLQEVAGDVHEYTSAGLGSLARVYSATRSFAGGQEPAGAPQIAFKSVEAPQIDIVAAGASAELAGLERLGLAAGSKEVVALRSTRDMNHDKTGVATNKVDRLLRSEVAYAGKTAACDARKKLLPRVGSSETQWMALAGIPARVKFLRQGAKTKTGIDAASLQRSTPEIRAIIKRIPAGTGKPEWPTVNEFRKLHEIIGFAGVNGTGIEADNSPGSEVADEVSIHVWEKLGRGAAAEDSPSPETQRQRE